MKTHEAKATLANKVIDLNTLVKILSGYDRKVGSFPGQRYEGKAVGRHVLRQLGFGEESITAVFGKPDFRESDRSRNMYRDHVWNGHPIDQLLANHDALRLLAQILGKRR